MAMTRAVVPAAMFGVIAFAVASCSKQADGPPPPPTPTVRVARPVMYSVQSYLSYNGYLEAVETVEVKARVKGILQDIHFVEGVEVSQGAKLYSIDPREYRSAVTRSQAELAKADADIQNQKAQVRLAKVEADRLERSRGSVASAEIDKARASLDVSEAELAVAEASQDAAAAALQTANIQLGYTDIKAPIAGRISRTLVTKGNLVGQAEPTLLTTIVSMDPIFVYYDAPERDLVDYQQALQNKESASVGNGKMAVEVGIATEDAYPHRGVIDFQENRVDSGTGTVRIRGQLPNPPTPGSGTRLLYPGLYAQVRVPKGAPTMQPVIPEDALMTDQTGRYVFVIGAENKVEKRVVTVGDRVWRAGSPGTGEAIGWGMVNPKPDPNAKEPTPVRLPVQAAVAITQGLSAEDQVIISGLQRVRPGGPANPELWELRAPTTPASKPPSEPAGPKS